MGRTIEFVIILSGNVNNVGYNGSADNINSFDSFRYAISAFSCHTRVKLISAILIKLGN